MAHARLTALLRAEQGSSSAPSGATPSALAINPNGWGPQVWPQLEWRRIVTVVVGLMLQHGFRSRGMTPVGLRGMDLLLQSDARQQQLRMRCLGTPDLLLQQDVQQFMRHLRQQRARSGTLVAPFGFTPAARELAAANRIHSLDGDGLLKLIGQQPTGMQRTLLRAAMAGEHSRPSCIRCGIKLEQRTHDQTGYPYWGCPNAPTCDVRLPASPFQRADITS